MTTGDDIVCVTYVYVEFLKEVEKQRMVVVGGLEDTVTGRRRLATMRPFGAAPALITPER